MTELDLTFFISITLYIFLLEILSAKVSIAQSSTEASKNDNATSPEVQLNCIYSVCLYCSGLNFLWTVK